MGRRAPRGGCCGPGQVDRAERPRTLNLQESRPGLNRSGAGRPGSATQRLARGPCTPLSVGSSALESVRPEACPPRNRPARRLGHPGPRGLRRTHSPTPGPQGWGWLSAEGREMEHCPPLPGHLSLPVTSYPPPNLPQHLCLFIGKNGIKSLPCVSSRSILQQSVRK